MRPFRLSVATHCFEQPIKPALRSAASVGAGGVQIDARRELRPTDLSDTGRREFLHHLDELGLAVAALHFSTRRPLHEQVQLDARLSAIKDAMQFARQLKSRVLTGRIGRIPEDENSVDYETLLQVLNDLARHGNRVGVTFTITPSRDAPQTLLKLIDAVSEGPVGVNFDPAVFVMGGHNPADALRTLHAVITNVQVRDALRDIDGSGREVPVGRGEVEWDEMLALIDEAGYRGWMTVDRTEGSDKPTDVAHAIQYLLRLAQEG